MACVCFAYVCMAATCNRTDAILATMMRRFLTCMLMMLAFQFPWSAISAYCMHETGRAAQHLGHHQHKTDAHDQVVAADDGKPSSTKKIAQHSHCSSCAHAVLAPAAVQTAPYLTMAHFAPVGPNVNYASIIQVPPERPQWPAAV